MAQLKAWRKHCSIDLKFKLEVLNEVDRKIKSKTEIAAQFGIPKSTLSTILKNRQKIENTVEKAKNKSTAWVNMMRIREAAHPKLEEALFDWLKKAQSENVSVDGNLLKIKAEELSHLMGIENAKFSGGWLQNFKKRHNLSFQKGGEESRDANDIVDTTWKDGSSQPQFDPRDLCSQQHFDASDLCSQQQLIPGDMCNQQQFNPSDVCNQRSPVQEPSWSESRLQLILNAYKPEDIYNADEVVLLFEVLPSHVPALKNKRCREEKRSEIRITVMLATNMTGTDKLKLFIIGKPANPCCFKGIKTLPVTYASSRKALMTKDLFTRWLHDLDRLMARNKRHIVLIVDNCDAHVTVEGLTNIKMECLPPNVNTLFQPMEQGIIAAFKCHYRTNVLQRLILNLYNDEDYEIDLLQAMYLSAVSWDAVSSKVIADCFHHSGFIQTEGHSTSDMSECDITQYVIEGQQLLDRLHKHNFEIPTDLTFSDFLNVDSWLDCTFEETNEVAVKDEPSDSESDMQLTKSSLKNAVDAISTLRNYLHFERDVEEYLKMTFAIERKLLSTFQNNLQEEGKDFS